MDTSRIHDVYMMYTFWIQLYFLVYFFRSINFNFPHLIN
nr:MAG TPA: hypothetical protein [Caudoviricetes sp.]